MRKFIIVAYLTFSAALTPVAAKYIVAQVSPLSLAFFRFGLATLLLVFVFIYKKQSFRIDKKDIPAFAILGALVIPINQFFFLEGVRLSTASFSGVMYACTPVFIYIIAVLKKHENFEMKKLMTISLSIIGIVIIFWENLINIEATGRSVIVGDIFLFFAVLSWAVYLALAKNVVTKYGSLKTSTISFIFGMILYIPLFVYDYHNFTLDKLNFYGVLGFFHLAVLVAFAGYFIYSYSIKIISTSTLTTLTNSAPVFTLIFSYILLNEELSYFFIIGSCVTLIGVFLTNRIDRSRTTFINR